MTGGIFNMRATDTPKKTKPDPQRVLTWMCLICDLVWRQPRPLYGYKGKNQPPPCDGCGDFDSTMQVDWYDVVLAKRLGFPGAKVVLKEIGATKQR